jgi:hypothetical protein
MSSEASAPTSSPSITHIGRFEWDGPVSDPIFDGLTIHAVVATPNHLIVLGRGPERQQVVGLSSDGRSWTATVLPPDAEEPVAAAEADGMLVVVARDLDKASETGQIWVSTDGGAWAQRLSLRGTAEIFDVASTSAGFIVVGLTHTKRGYHGTLWRSQDGRAWVAEELPSEAALQVETLRDDRLIIAAPGPVTYAGRPRHWARAVLDRDRVPAALLPGPTATLLLTGSCVVGRCGNRDIWRATDGTDWRPIDLGDVIDRFVPVAATDDLFVGREFVGGDSGAPMEIVLWTSADGMAWNRDPGPFGPTVVPHLAWRDGILFAVAGRPEGPSGVWEGTPIEP